MKHTNITINGSEVAALYEGLNLLYKKRLKSKRLGSVSEQIVTIDEVEALKQRLFEAYRETEAD